MIVLVLDPGHTTGWAVLTEEKIVATGIFPFYRDVKMLIEQYKPDKAVLEDFTLYPWKSHALAWSQLQTVQTLGVMKYLLADESGIPYELQTASLVKSLSKRLIGTYHSQHERDSVTHGLVYLQRQGLLSKNLRRLLWRRE